MQGDEGYAVLSGLEEDADKVVEAAESNEAVADAARQAADAANEVAAAVDGMRSDVSRSLKDIRASIKSMGAAASPIADMQEALETDRASMAEALGVLREISAAMRTFESLGGTQHQDGTNGGAWAPEDMGALAEGITGPIVAAINELTEKGKSEAETQRSAVTSTTRTTSEAAVRMGERIDGSFARLSDAFSASMRDLIEAEQRRHEESMRRIDAVQAASSGIDRAQALAGSAVQVENLLRDALRGGFDVRKLAPQLASAIGSAFPALAEGFEHAENLKAIPQKAAQQAASKVRPGDGDEMDRYEVEEPAQRSPEEQDTRDVENVRDEVGEPASSSPEEHGADKERDEDDGPAPRSPEEQDAMDVENVRDGVLSALRDHDGEVERSEELEAGREREEAVSVIEEGTESIPQAVGESVADEVSDSAAQQQQGLDAGLDVAAQPEQAMGFGGSLLERAIGLVSGTRMGKALGRTKFGEKTLGMAGASAVGEAVVEAGASAVGKAAGAAGAAAGAEAAGSAVAKALGTAGEAIGGAVSKALGPIGLALTAYEGVQAALDIGQGLANASISQTGRADAVQGASISAQLGAQRAAATMTSALTDDQAKSIQDTLTSSGMRYDDEDFSEAFEFAKQMNLRYGVDVTQAARQYVDSVKRGTSSTEQLYKSMDLLADVSDRTGQSFESLRDGYQKSVDGLTDAIGSEKEAIAMWQSSIEQSGGNTSVADFATKNLQDVSGNMVESIEYRSRMDEAARNIGFGSFDEWVEQARNDVNARSLLQGAQREVARGVAADYHFLNSANGYRDMQTVLYTDKGGNDVTLADVLHGNVIIDETGETGDTPDEAAEKLASGLYRLMYNPDVTGLETTYGEAVEKIRQAFNASGSNVAFESSDPEAIASATIGAIIGVKTDEDATNAIEFNKDENGNYVQVVDTSNDNNGLYLSSNMEREYDWNPFSAQVSKNEQQLMDMYKQDFNFDAMSSIDVATITGNDGKIGTIQNDPWSFYDARSDDWATGMIDSSLSNEYTGPFDLLSDGVSDKEADVIVNSMLKRGVVSQSDIQGMSVDKLRDIARTLVDDFSEEFYSNGEDLTWSEYLSRDEGKSATGAFAQNVRDARISEGNMTTSDLTNYVTTPILTAFSNGLSMDVTINADGIGNIATAVANCQTKSSSDAGTNG